MHKPNDRRWLFLLTTVLVLPAVLPLLQTGYFDSDDGWIHLYRLAALDRALHSGVPFPRSFPDFAFGYGYPVLNFYSPLGYYLAEFWHLLGANYIVAMKLTFAAGFLLAAWTMYLFAADVMGAAAGVLAAIAYTYAPYHLADAYQRGALAEHLAFLWFPLMLGTLRRLIHTGQRRYIAWTGLCGAGLILTHNLSALIFAPVAAVYALMLIWENERMDSPTAPGRAKGPLLESLLASLSLALLLALTLSAFYWLPAIAESRYVHLALDFGSTGYRDHLAPVSELASPFLRHRYFPEQGVAIDHPVGRLQLSLAVLGLIGLAFDARRRTGRHLRAPNVALFALAVTGASLFLTTDASLPLWHAAERVLSVLQYPWRFMALVAFGTALLSGGMAGLLPERLATKPGATVVLLFLVTVAMGYAGLSRLEYDVEPVGAEQITVQRMWDEDFDQQQIGATWTAEYLPRWVQQERWAIPRVAPEPPSGPVGSAITAARLTAVTPRSIDLALTLEDRQPISLHRFYFPGWSATVDGNPAGVYPRGMLGLATVDVPAGTHRLSFHVGTTPARHWGEMASLLSVAALAAVGVWRASRRWRTILLAGLVIGAGAAAVHFRPWVSPTTLTPAEEVLGSRQIQFLGYRLDRAAYLPGDTARVTLYWMGLAPLQRDYKAFVHLTAADSPVPFSQHDGDPAGGYTPTTRWSPGELVADTHAFRLPTDLPPGRYPLWAGLYDHATGKRLRNAGSSGGDGRLSLGEVTVQQSD